MDIRDKCRIQNRQDKAWIVGTERENIKRNYKKGNVYICINTYILIKH